MLNDRSSFQDTALYCICLSLKFIQMDTKRASISLSKIAMLQNGRQWLAIYIGHVTLSKMAGNCPAPASARVIEKISFKIFAFMGHLLEAWLTTMWTVLWCFPHFRFFLSWPFKTQSFDEGKTGPKLYFNHIQHRCYEVLHCIECILYWLSTRLTISVFMVNQLKRPPESCRFSLAVKHRPEV